MTPPLAYLAGPSPADTADRLVSVTAAERHLQAAGYTTWSVFDVAAPATVGQIADADTAALRRADVVVNLGGRPPAAVWAVAAGVPVLTVAEAAELVCDIPA